MTADAHHSKAPPWRGWSVPLRRRPITFSLFFLLLPVAAVFSHRSIAPLMVIALIAAPWREMAGRLKAFLARPISDPLLAMAAALVALTAWTAASVAWTPDAAQGVEIAYNFSVAIAVSALFLVALTSLVEDDAGAVARAAAIGFMAAAVGLAVEGVTGGMLRTTFSPPQEHIRHINSLGRGASILIMLALPAAAIIHTVWSRRVVTGAFLAVTFVAAATLGMQSNLLAAAFAAAAFGAALIAPRATLFALFALFLGGLLLMPLFAQGLSTDAVMAPFAKLPLTWLQRVAAWREAGLEISAHPLIGGGVDYARHITGLQQCVEVRGASVDVATARYWITDCEQSGVAGVVTVERMPLHPHNAFLQIWMELGAIGAAAAALLLAALWRAADGLVFRSGTRRRWSAGVIAGVAAAFFAYAMAEWSIWQVWRIGLVWCAGAVTVFALRRVQTVAQV